MSRSVWLKDGVSTFPVQQPMVGQREFYDAFKAFIGDLKDAPMARIFPLIAKWGIGKSRIGYEIISEALGNDKGWKIRNKEGEDEKVRLLNPDFADGILPIYIRYEQMNEDYLYGENWVGYGAYIALTKLANDQFVTTTIQNSIIKEIQNHFQPMGFSEERLGQIIEKGKYTTEELLNPYSDVNKLDKLVQKGMDYLKAFGIEHLMVIVDEVESEYEIFQDGIKEDKEERKKKLDGKAIKVITQAIKHEDSRTRHPNVSFLLLCSPAIGDQIKSLEALDRRGEKLEITQNSYADITDYIESLQKEGKMREYPQGLVEAAYTIAAGNFGWLNVIMAHCEQYLEQHPEEDAGDVLLDRAYAITRFKDSLIDHSQLDYIDTNESNKPLVKKALLRQLPYPKSKYSNQEKQILLSAKHIEGIPLFKEFVEIPLAKNEIGYELIKNKYRADSDHMFVNVSTGEKFSLDVMLRSLETFSIHAPSGHYIIGKDRETFLAQVHMLYPKDEVADAADILYAYLQQIIKNQTVETYIGPNFTFLQRLNRRYAVKTGIANYLLSEEKDQKLQEYLKERKKEYGKDIQRVLLGFVRAIELDYPEVSRIKINGKECGIRTVVAKDIYLGVHPKSVVDVIWANELNQLSDIVDSNILDCGAHPIIILSTTADTENEIEKLKREYPYAGRCVLFFQVTNLQKGVLDVLSVDQSYIDIRPVAHELSTTFKNKIRSIREEISKIARTWFEQVDQKGYVLRPLIFSKTEVERLPLLAKGFKKMLIHDATLAELGAKQGVKFTETEDFNRFQQVLDKTFVGTKLAKEGYQHAGLFNKDEDGQYIVEIPATFTSLLSYIDKTKRYVKDIQGTFFFSSVDVIKPPKIVEQWLHFLQELKVVKVRKGTHVQNIMKQDLEEKRDYIQKWLNEEYDKLVNEFDGTIDSDRLNILRKYKLHGNIERINETLLNIDLSMLQEKTNQNITVWKEQLEQLEVFHEECDFIFNEAGWKNLQLTDRRLGELNIDAKGVPLWEKIRLVQQFHDYISNLQKNISSKLSARIDEIKESSNYQGYTLPIAPYIYLLELYKNEIENATEYKESLKYKTLVSRTETLAHHLSLANYKEAIDRTNTIINDLGLKKTDQTSVEWKNSGGVVGRYDKLKEKFVQLIDLFEEYKSRANNWFNYYEGTSDEILEKVGVHQLRNTYDELSLFLDSGFDQEVDDLFSSKKAKPREIIDDVEKLLQGQKSNGTTLVSTITSVDNQTRKQRDQHYENDVINTVNRIYNVLKKPQYQPDINTEVKEATFIETIERVKDKMKKLEEDGRQFFESSNVVRFEFFKDVVKNNGNINWNSYTREKQELERLGLIKTKVVLV